MIERLEREGVLFFVLDRYTATYLHTPGLFFFVFSCSLSGTGDWDVWEREWSGIFAGHF